MSGTFIISLLSAPASATPLFGPHCPASIEVSQSIAHAPAGWTVLTAPARHDWEDIIFLSGPVAERGFLAGNQRATQGHLQIATWRFAAAEVADTILLGCAYTNTAVILFQKLDPRVRFCQATYSRPTGAILGVTCRAD